MYGVMKEHLVHFIRQFHEICKGFSFNNAERKKETNELTKYSAFYYY
jgi:hypothetical protein